MGARRTWKSIRSGSRNVSFDDLVGVAKAFGFVHVRTSGSHHIFNHPGLPGMLNLQRDAHQAKPYQIRQLVRLVERYGLSLRGDDGADED